MLRVGLTGNRYSGKDTICKVFRQEKVPVFNTDVILKFILNHEYLILEKIKDTIGEEYFNKNGLIDTSEIENNKKFYKILEIIKPYIFEAYEKFEKKHSGSVYTIFHSSILFESGWYKEMDIKININTPLDERLKRLFVAKKIDCDFSKFDIENLLKTESKPSLKNKSSDIIIHNFGMFDVLDQVNKADIKIVNTYLKSRNTINI